MSVKVAVGRWLRLISVADRVDSGKDQLLYGKFLVIFFVDMTSVESSSRCDDVDSRALEVNNNYILS